MDDTEKYHAVQSWPTPERSTALVAAEDEEKWTRSPWMNARITQTFQYSSRWLWEGEMHSLVCYGRDLLSVFRKKTTAPSRRTSCEKKGGLSGVDHDPEKERGTVLERVKSCKLS